VATHVRFAAALVWTVCLLAGSPAFAQIVQTPAPSAPDSAAPRPVGRKGARQVSVYGSITARPYTVIDREFDERGRFMGYREVTTTETDIFAGLDHGWFVSDHVTVRIGTSFSGSSTGSVFNGLSAGCRVYAAPARPSSLYVMASGGFATWRGGETSSNAGSAEGGVGFESVVGTNASFFVEALAQRFFTERGSTQALAVVGIRVVY
jgi:hypothetical protein